MITNKTGGTLYTRDGRKLIDIKGVSGSSRTSEEICAQRKVKHTVPDTLCFQTVSGDLRRLYSFVYGMEITNNFLKIHGGIMVRNAAVRKSKRSMKRK